MAILDRFRLNCDIYKQQKNLLHQQVHYIVCSTSTIIARVPAEHVLVGMFKVSLLQNSQHHNTVYVFTNYQQKNRENVAYLLVQQTLLLFVYFTMEPKPI